MTTQTNDERRQAAIRSLRDPSGLGLPDLEGSIQLVHVRCKACRRPIAAVIKTQEGPLFVGRAISELTLGRMAELRRLNADHRGVVQASWEPRYALLVAGNWHGELVTYCDKDGQRTLDPATIKAEVHVGLTPAHPVELSY